MTQKIKIEDFIRSLESNTSFDVKNHKTDLMKLSTNAYGKFDNFMYQHGVLLYSLIAKYQPKNILEIGTGGGYSSLFMSWALADYNIDGKICTVDRYSIDKPFKRKLADSHFDYMTVEEMWKRFGPSNWNKLIEVVTGHSGEIFGKRKFSPIDFVFIDGAHDYESVKHDFYSCIEIMSNDFCILFDDYIERPFYGVKKFVDDYILPNFNAKLIETGKILVNNEYREHARCFIESKSIKKQITELYPKEKYESFLKKYRRHARLITKNRERLNQQFPFLRKIRFRWYNKN